MTQNTKIMKSKFILMILGMVGIFSIIYLMRTYPERASTLGGTIICLLGMIAYGFFIYVGIVFKEGDTL